MINISRIKQIDDNKNLILLANQEKIFDNIQFSDAPIKYIKAQIEKKQDFITINEYDRFIVIVVVDNNLEQNKLNELLRKKGKAVADFFNKEQQESASLICSGEFSGFVNDFLEGMLLGSYQFLRYFTKDIDKKTNHFKNLYLQEDLLKSKDIKKLTNLVKSVYFTRDLVNEPYGNMQTADLVKELKSMAKEVEISFEHLGKKQIESLKMGGLLAVNKGSQGDPAFVIMEWNPKNPVNEAPVVLVGKGIVYDTGGYSLKPTPQSMDYMKCDMAGAASVAGIIYAIAANNIPLHVICLIPITDNALSNSSYVPGDVIKMHNKLTVEVLNTDAEGRLILADALSYAIKYKPDLVIDMATLTGSAMVAVGAHAIVAMGNAKNETFELLESAGDECFERIARFPFWDEYKKELESTIADLKNIGGREGGAITAGKFLEHFVDYQWIHLDIATNAFIQKPMDYWGQGATGVGVRLVYNFLKRKYLGGKK